MKTFKINSVHEVYEDSWENGQGEIKNFYTLSSQFLGENWKDAVKKYFENYLCYDVDMGNLNEVDEENYLHYSVLVDENNFYFTDEQYNLWKEGKYKLYSNDISIKIYELTEVELK